MSSFEDEKTGVDWFGVLCAALFSLAVLYSVVLIDNRLSRLEAIHAEEIRLEVEQH